MVLMSTRALGRNSTCGMCTKLTFITTLLRAVLNEVCLSGPSWLRMMHVSKLLRSDQGNHRLHTVLCVGQPVLTNQHRRRHSIDVLGKIC